MKTVDLLDMTPCSLINTCRRGCRNPERHVALSSKFCTVVPLIVRGQCRTGCVWWVVSVELTVFCGWSVWNWLCFVGGQCRTGCVLWVVSVELAVFCGWSVWN